jgi:tyrosyl-tRNA synthetase
MTLSEELQWRGFVNQTTLKQIDDINTPRTFYLGVDPSADSMQIGNLAVVMLVRHLIAHGHRAIVLVGGATGMIGDPKDDQERQLKTLDEISKNKAAIAEEYTRILGDLPFEIVDNYDWFKTINYLDFLRDIGKHFSMTQLIDRDFVKKRVGSQASGLSYAEFSYSLIQGYDFLHLYRTKGVSLQIGGSDQWGNMLSGIPLIRKLANGEAHVWTLPLIINKTTGVKFGKSEAGTIWLSEQKTSVYDFYQFWLNVEDDGVIDYLKIYTTLDTQQMSMLEHSTIQQPAAREAQKALAYEVTSLVHGKDKALSAKTVTSVLFGGKNLDELSDEEKRMLASQIPTASAGQNIVSALVETGVATSNSEARRLLQAGGITVEGEKVTSEYVTRANTLIKKGKNSYIAVL